MIYQGIYEQQVPLLPIAISKLMNVNCDLNWYRIGYIYIESRFRDRLPYCRKSYGVEMISFSSSMSVEGEIVGEIVWGSK